MKKFLKIKRKRNSKFSRCNKKKRMLKKYLLDIYSPHNTNDFLINNNSSPFFSGDEDEETIIIRQSSPIRLVDEANSELNLFADKENETESTEERTKIALNNKVQIFLIQR